MNENGNEVIDIKSDVVIGLASEYQGINSEISSMAAGCSKPAVPSFLNVGGHIDGLMNTVKEAEGKLSSKMSEVVSLLNQTLDKIKANDEVNMLDFFTLEEDFNFAVDLSSIEGQELTDEDKQALIFSLCLYAGKDVAGFKETIDSNEYLSETDKTYILEQLEKGNVRSAIGRMLCIQAEEDLNELEKINNDKIHNIELDLIDLYDQRSILNMSSLESNSKELKKVDEQISALENNIQELRQEITAQRLKVNQYKNSEKEWEYDYLLNKVGTKEFENVVANNEDKEFYRKALEYYYSVNHDFTDADNDIFNYEHFYVKTMQWLNSPDNGLGIEDKTKYLEKLKSMSPVGSLLTEDYYAFSLAVGDLANDKSFNSSRFDDLYNKNAFTIEGDIPLSNATKYFDEDHLKVLKYFYNSGDYAGAREYINTFSDYFNKCKGMENANEIIQAIINGENVSSVVGDITSYLKGTGVGLRGWFQSVANLLSSNGQMTETEYTQMYVNNMLGSFGLLNSVDGDFATLGITSSQYEALKKQYGNDISYLDIMHINGKIGDDEYNNMQKLKNQEGIQNFINNANRESTFGKTHAKWLQTFFGAGVSMGNMLPSVAISFATSGLLSEAGVAINSAQKFGRAAGLFAMGVGCASTSKNSALRSGRSNVQAWAYGILNGLSETATEYLIGGMPGLSRLDKAFKLLPSDKTFSIVGKSLLNTFLIAPGQEITEEMIQAYIFDPLVSELSYGESSDPVSINQALEIVAQTYLSTLGLGGFTAIPQTAGVISKSNTVIGTFDINGKPVEVTYGKLMDSIDKETGKISKEKLQNILQKDADSISLKDVAEGAKSLFKKASTVAAGMFLNSPVVNTVSDAGVTETSVNDELFNADTMPLSLDPIRRALQEKLLNGEKLSMFDLTKFRDKTVKNIDGYDLKPDHAYRAMSVKEYLEHEKTGWIEGPPNDQEYEETVVDGKTVNNNAGVDWYLGAAALKYGQVVLEVPALKKYFTTASDGGNGMTQDPTVKHLKSSPHDNPIPLSLAKVVAGNDLILETKANQAVLSDTSETVDEEIIKLVNTEKFQNAPVSEQKQMISGITDYDSLPTNFKLQLFKELLEKSAAKQGMTVKELGNQKGEGITDPVKQAKAEELATEKRAKAESVEPAITEIMKSLEDDNAILIGLNHKLKGKDSLARKILSENKRTGVDLDVVSDEINDSVRYTMITDESNYLEKSKETLKKLQDEGYTIKFARNTWNNLYYKGLNTTIQTPSGVNFELQFHTTDSFIIKDCDSHIYYEIRRNDFVDESDKALATEIQRLYTSTIPNPDGIVGYDFLQYLEQAKSETEAEVLKDLSPDETKVEPKAQQDLNPTKNETDLEVQKDLSSTGNVSYTLSKTGEYAGNIGVDVNKSGTTASMDFYVPEEYLGSDIAKKAVSGVIDDVFVKKLLNGVKISSSVVSDIDTISVNDSSDMDPRILKTFEELGFNQTKKGLSLDKQTFLKKLKSVPETSTVITRENQSIQQIVSKIDGTNVVERMRDAGIGEDIIKKFTTSLEKATSIIDKCKVYDPKMSQEELIKQMTIDYGDAGKEINKLLMDGKTADDIREILKDSPKELEEFEDFLKNTKSGQFIATLNGRKIRGIDSYSGGNLHNIQNALFKLKDNSPHMIMAEDISEALAGAPSLGEDTLLYRGDNPKSLLYDKKMKEILSGVDLNNNEEVVLALQNAIGLSIQPLGFVSTSPGYNTSFAGRENKRVVFEIIAPDGTNGAYINQISEFYNKENEYLLNYRIIQRILDVYLGDDGKVHIVTIVEK